MHDNHQSADAVEPVDHARDSGRTTLEFCFIAVVGLIVMAAFVAALGYEFVSARTPIVIMVPLLVLIGVQFFRSLRTVRKVDAGAVLSAVAKGRDRTVNRTTGFIGWMIVFMALIVAVGHYAAIALVMFTLLRLVSRERPALSLALAVGMTVSIYLVFELGFDIELHRGAISRMLAGFGGS